MGNGEKTGDFRLRKSWVGAGGWGGGSVFLSPVNGGCGLLGGQSGLCLAKNDAKRWD